MKDVIVKQVEGAEVPAEVLASSIVAISEGVKKLRAGRLNDKALVLLIQNAAPGNVPKSDILAVLDGMAALEKLYLKPTGGKK